jgi:hypothetical protein
MKHIFSTGFARLVITLIITASTITISEGSPAGVGRVGTGLVAYYPFTRVADGSGDEWCGALVRQRQWSGI